MVLVVGVLRLGARPARCQEAGAPPAMTLDEALAWARGHQPALRAARAREATREREARIPRAAWMPQIGATAQVLYGTANNSSASYLNVPEVDLPRIGGTRSITALDMTPAASTIAALSLTQEVYDFGRIAAQAAAADALVEAARADAELAGLDTTLAVEEAFDAVLAGREILTAANDAYKRSLAHRDFAQAGVKSGMRPPVDLTRAAADLAVAEVRRIRAATGLVAARSGLAAAIASDALEVDARVNGVNAAPASPGLADALQLAARRNPLLVSALATVRAREASTQAIGHELLPNLFGSAGISGRAGGNAPSSGSVPAGDGWLPDVLNWHAGLVLQWNLFDATVLARRAAARAGEEEARASYEVARLSTVIAVERAYLDLEAAMQTIPGLAQTVAAAQANQAQADARFRAGLGTALELADAETLLADAQVELAIGRFNADRSRARLARAIGAAVKP